jgi:hypothetical protein
MSHIADKVIFNAGKFSLFENNIYHNYKNDNYGKNKKYRTDSQQDNIFRITFVLRKIDNKKTGFGVVIAKN